MLSLESRVWALALVLIIPAVWLAVPTNADGCTITIEDKSYVTGDTKNVGQEINLKAVVTGGPKGDINWRIQGEIIEDYTESPAEMYQALNKLQVIDIIESDSDNPVAHRTGEDITFYWREKGQIEPGPNQPAKSRLVHVDNTADMGDVTCATTKTFTIERNSDDLKKQAVDWYVNNHGGFVAEECLSAGQPGTVCDGWPTGDGAILNEHFLWHRTWEAVGTKKGLELGERFLNWHHWFLKAFSLWRGEFGYSEGIKTEHPFSFGILEEDGTALPTIEDGFNINHNGRVNTAPMNPKPGYLRTGNGGDFIGAGFTAGPDGSIDIMEYNICEHPNAPIEMFDSGGIGQKMLVNATDGKKSYDDDDFDTLRELGCGIINPWHNVGHSRMGGIMGSLASPRDPIFWRWHNNIDSVREDWLNARKNAGFPGTTAAIFPMPGRGISGDWFDNEFSAVHVSFTDDVSNIIASDLTVNGSPATDVVGSGTGPFTFSGFAMPNGNTVNVSLGSGLDSESSGKSFDGRNWSYTVRSCLDSDSDGVFEGECWPESGAYDNCPENPNPTQLDTDDDHLGDACDPEPTIPEYHLEVSLNNIVYAIHYTTDSSNNFDSQPAELNFVYRTSSVRFIPSYGVSFVEFEIPRDFMAPPFDVRSSPDIYFSNPSPASFVLTEKSSYYSVNVSIDVPYSSLNVDGLMVPGGTIIFDNNIDIDSDLENETVVKDDDLEPVQVLVFDLDGDGDGDLVKIGADVDINDLDGDGYSNSMEIAEGTDPMNANSYPITIIDTDSDGIDDSIDQCPNTPSGDTVDEHGCSESQLDTDSDGIDDSIDQCPNTPSGDTVDEHGCSESQLDEDNDGVNNSEDKCPGTASGEVVNEEGCVDTDTSGNSNNTVIPPDEKKAKDDDESFIPGPGMMSSLCALVLATLLYRRRNS